MFSSRILLLFSCLFVFLLFVRAAPVVTSNDIVERVPEPQGMGGVSKDWKREAQGMGGSGKDWKREPQPGMGGFDQDWKREPQPGMGGFDQDWKREPQPGMGGFDQDWKRDPEAAPEPQGFGGVSKDW